MSSKTKTDCAYLASAANLDSETCVCQKEIGELRENFMKGTLLESERSWRVCGFAQGLIRNEERRFEIFKSNKKKCR